MDKIIKLENDINDVLYHEKEGLLIKFHSGKGLDYEILEELYNHLEEFKSTYKIENLVPKNIMLLLIGILPSLHIDLDSYSDDPVVHEKYSNEIYKLDTALHMCLNSNLSDPHMNTPLKDL